MRQAEAKAAQAGITDESLPREGCLTWKMAADRHLNYAWGVTCKHAAQKAGLRRYGKRARWAPQRKAPCRITAIAACGLIYTTPLGPVKLDDLKDQVRALQRRVSQSDRRQLDAYLDAIRTLERRIAFVQNEATARRLARGGAPVR